MAELYGGKWVFFVAIVINVTCTLLSPICAAAGFEYLILMRILMGLGGGLTFPAMNVLVAEWAPKQERSTMSSIIYGGKTVATSPNIMQISTLLKHCSVQRVNL